MPQPLPRRQPQKRLFPQLTPQHLEHPLVWTTILSEFEITGKATARQFWHFIMNERATVRQLHYYSFFSCNNFAHNGYCTDPLYKDMQDLCPKSCGLCHWCKNPWINIFLPYFLVRQGLDFKKGNLSGFLAEINVFLRKILTSSYRKKNSLQGGSGAFWKKWGFSSKWPRVSPPFWQFKREARPTYEASPWAGNICFWDDFFIAKLVKKFSTTLPWQHLENKTFFAQNDQWIHSFTWKETGSKQTPQADSLIPDYDKKPLGARGMNNGSVYANSRQISRLCLNLRGEQGGKRTRPFFPEDQAPW